MTDSRALNRATELVVVIDIQEPLCFPDDLMQLL